MGQIMSRAASNASSPGSMADVPKDLLQEIQKLEQLFTVPTEKLKEITDHFIHELDKGKLYSNHMLCVLMISRSQC